MAKIDLTQIGITGTTEIVYNPSYELLFEEETKAGLTGFAQVYGRYKTPSYNKLKLDLMYIEHYSIWLDIKIMLLTIKIIFNKENSEGIIQTDRCK